MSAVSDHDAFDELLGAYALDAVDPDEAAALERHLETCPRCRGELDALRELAAALGNGFEAPPPHLWDRIAGGLEGAEPSAPVPPPALGTRPVVAHPGRGRPARRVRVAAVVTIAAALIACALLGARLSATNAQLHSARQALGAVGLVQAADAAKHAPGHRDVSLTTPAGSTAGQAVVLPDGRGYLWSASLAALPSDRTYQLWGVIDGRPVSLGLLGSDPKTSAFTVSTSRTPSALAITDEPAGGSVAPSSTPVASGAVEA